MLLSRSLSLSPLFFRYTFILSSLIPIFLITVCDRRFLSSPYLPYSPFSLSLSLACSCGSSVDRVSSMRTERPGVGRQLLWRPTKASTTTTTTSTTTVAAALAAPAHHHHPGHRSARQFLVFSSEGLPFSKCAAALRVRAIFLCERRGETGPAVKKRISGRCCVRLEICRAWSRKLLSKSRRDFLSRYIHLIAIRNNAVIKRLILINRN